MSHEVNKFGWRKTIMLVYVAVLVGCSQTPNSSALSDMTPLSSSITQTPPQRSPAMPQISQTPNSFSITNMVENAKEDLAQRLSISREQINVLEAKDVTWPDSSIGCPQAGMAYAQVLTPGYLVRLEFNHQEYEYHAGKGAEVFYCENPSPPFFGTPGNT